MKLIILASSRHGTASQHLAHLIRANVSEISMVVLNEGIIVDKKKHYKIKFRKMLKIGLLGALNGIRMRKWFSHGNNGLEDASDLEEVCKKNNIPFFTTPRINCEQTADLFKRANADLGLSLGNGYIGQKIFSKPKYGMLNLHHELLPAYQNAQSIIWQIYNMSGVTGYTIHKIDKHIDTGEILFQESIPISFENTLQQTISRTSASLQTASAQGLVKVLRDFENLYKNAKPQGKGRSYTTPSIWQFLKIQKNYRKLKSQAELK